MAQHDLEVWWPWSPHASVLSLLLGKKARQDDQNNLSVVSCTMLWSGKEVLDEAALGHRPKQLPQLRASHPLRGCPNMCHVPYESHLHHQREAGEMCQGFALFRAAKDYPKGFLNPSSWAPLGPGDQGAGGWFSQAAALGSWEEENWYTSRVLPDWLLSPSQNQHPLMGLFSWQKAIYFMLTTSWFPIPLPFSPNCNYPCRILTMQLVKAMTEIFPGQPNSNSHTSA